MEQHLEELQRLDRGFELDQRQGHQPLGPVPPPRPLAGAKPRKQRGAALPGLLVAGLVMAGVFLLDPSASGQRLRDLAGLSGPLGELVGIPDGDGPYRFVATQPGSKDPVSWNRCRPIRYVVNPEGAPDDWEDMVTEAVAEISEASGFEFEDEGTTEDRDFDRRLDGFGRPSPVLIGWADEEEVPRLAGDVAGLGGSTYVEETGRRRFITGSIALDRDLFDELETARDGSDLSRAIVIHELGHVLGLDHVEDEGELMNAENVGRTELGPGDLEGLARLGAVGCG